MWQFHVFQSDNGGGLSAVTYQPDWVVASGDAFTTSPNPLARAMLSDSLEVLRQHVLILMGRPRSIYSGEAVAGSLVRRPQAPRL